jgi:hypothetical protein
MTNATATAPARATKTRAQTPQAHSTSASPVDAPQQAADWRDLVRNAIINIHDLLVSAMDAGCGGLPQELAHVADDTLSALRDAPNEHEDWEDFLATHHALNRSRVILSAAIYAEMDSMANEPSQLVRQSCLLDTALSWVTSTMDAVEHLPSSLEVLRSVSLAQGPRTFERSPSLQALTPPQKPTESAQRDLLNGFTAKQLELALSHVAGMAATVRDFIELAIADGAEVCPSMLLIAVSQIGSVADQIGGTHVIGSPVDWSFGRSFRMVGAA